jgi:hypothetical protein
VTECGPHAALDLVWLGTQTDGERDSRPRFLALRDSIAPHLADAGLPGNHVSGILVAANRSRRSIEIVTEVGFYALR